MKTTTGNSHTRWPVLLCALLACTAAHAQGVYRVVSPDGSVSFTDRPPTVTNKQSTRVEALNIPGASGGTDVDTSSLPEELQQAVSRFPVTIYTDKGCSPCDTGRSFLASRGIPFSERTISSAAGRDKLMEMTGGTSLPVLGIGAQQKLIGYTESEWARYLDVAGYPKTSRLPATYSPPAAKPLVEESAALDDTPAEGTGSAEDAPQGNATP